MHPKVRHSLCSPAGSAVSAGMHGMHCMTYIMKTSGDNHTYIGWKPVFDGSSQGILCFRRVHTSHTKADGSNSFPGFATASKGRCNCTKADQGVSIYARMCVLKILKHLLSPFTALHVVSGRQTRMSVKGCIDAAYNTLF